MGNQINRMKGYLLGSGTRIDSGEKRSIQGSHSSGRRTFSQSKSPSFVDELKELSDESFKSLSDEGSKSFESLEESATSHLPQASGPMNQKAPFQSADASEHRISKEARPKEPKKFNIGDSNEDSNEALLKKEEDDFYPDTSPAQSTRNLKQPGRLASNRNSSTAATDSPSSEAKKKEDGFPTANQSADASEHRISKEARPKEPKKFNIGDSKEYPNEALLKKEEDDFYPDTSPAQSTSNLKQPGRLASNRNSSTAATDSPSSEAKKKEDGFPTANQSADASEHRISKEARPKEPKKFNIGDSKEYPNEALLKKEEDDFYPDTSPAQSTSNLKQPGRLASNRNASTAATDSPSSEAKKKEDGFPTANQSADASEHRISKEARPKEPKKFNIGDSKEYPNEALLKKEEDDFYPDTSPAQSTSNLKQPGRLASDRNASTAATDSPSSQAKRKQSGLPTGKKHQNEAQGKMNPRTRTKGNKEDRFPTKKQPQNEAQGKMNPRSRKKGNLDPTRPVILEASENTKKERLMRLAYGSLFFNPSGVEVIQTHSQDPMTELSLLARQAWLRKQSIVPLEDPSQAPPKGFSSYPLRFLVGTKARNFLPGDPIPSKAMLINYQMLTALQENPGLLDRIPEGRGSVSLLKNHNFYFTPEGSFIGINKLNNNLQTISPQRLEDAINEILNEVIRLPGYGLKAS